MARKTEPKGKAKSRTSAKPTARNGSASTGSDSAAPPDGEIPTTRGAVSAAFQNFRVEWKPGADGSAELVVAYEGPLAPRDEVVARAGTWRQGSGPWTETRELPLRRQGASWVGAIPVVAGAPVEAVEFVFRAGDEWDNGGRAPLGYYEWTPRESRIEVR